MYMGMSWSRSGTTCLAREGLSPRMSSVTPSAWARSGDTASCTDHTNLSLKFSGQRWGSQMLGASPGILAVQTEGRHQQ